MSVRYAMVIDQRRCVGCHACVIACKAENNMPDDYSLNVVITENSSELDNPSGLIPLGNRTTMEDYKREGDRPRLDYLTRSCQHCLDAPCVDVCPTDATWQREDGIVMMEPKDCIGCENCMHACPYGYGTMRVWIRNPQFSADFAFGDSTAPETIDNTVKKCTFCAHRVDKGEQPYCVAHCPARARYFGDINNSGSDVVRLLSKYDFKEFPVEVGKTGTEPFVYFLSPKLKDD